MKNDNSKKPVFLIILGIVLLGICVGVLVFFVQTREENSANDAAEVESADDNADSVLQEASTTIYDNGDYTYLPAETNITFDDEDYVIYYNNILIAYLAEEMSEEDAGKLAATVNGELVGYINGSIHAIEIQVEDTGLNELNEMANQLMESDQVLYASYDFPMEMDAESVSANDRNPWENGDHSDSNHNGNEENPDGNDWWAESIGAYTAWNYVDSHQDDLSESIVGVIDNGFDVDHDDFMNSDSTSAINIFGKYTEADHGTHVSGIIGARNNETGIRGIDDKAQLYCIDFDPDTDDTEAKNYTSIMADMSGFLAMYSSLLQNDRIVVNNSWGIHLYTLEQYSYQNSDEDPLLALINAKCNFEKNDYNKWLKSYYEYAAQTSRACMGMILSILLSDQNHDFLIVQAAGNGYGNEGTDGYDAGSNGFFCGITEGLFNTLPTQTLKIWEDKGFGYQDVKDHILIVSGYSKEASDTVDSGYNYGDVVDICAPGGSVYSTFANNTYKEDSGTSMATPMATGSAALLWSIDPSLSAADVKNLLIETANTGHPGNANDTRDSYPMLNLGAAVKKLTTKSHDVTEYFNDIPALCSDYNLTLDSEHYAYAGSDNVSVSSLSQFEDGDWWIYNEGNETLTLYGAAIGDDVEDAIDRINAEHSIAVQKNDETHVEEGCGVYLNDSDGYYIIYIETKNNKITGWGVGNNDGEEGDMTVANVMDFLGNLNTDTPERHEFLEGMIFPDYEESLTDKQIAALSDEDLRWAINDIYARYGYIFTADDAKAHYSKLCWYEGWEASKDRITEDLTEYGGTEGENWKKLTAERNKRDGKNEGNSGSNASEGAWKDAYIDELTELASNSSYNSSYAYYYLFDLNGDAVPELLAFADNNADGTTLYTYSDGKVTSEYMGICDSSYYYSKGKNVFYVAGSGHMDYYEYYVYKIKNGKITQVFEGLLELDGTHSQYYYINDEEVSSSEWDKKLKDAGVTDNMNDIYSDTQYSLQEMMDYIRSY